MQGLKNGFGISPCMQELMTYAGHINCYVKCEELLEKYTSVKVSPSQIYRVTDYVSETLKDEDRKNCIFRFKLTPLFRSILTPLFWRY